MQKVMLTIFKGISTRVLSLMAMCRVLYTRWEGMVG